MSVAAQVQETLLEIVRRDVARLQEASKAARLSPEDAQLVVDYLRALNGAAARKAPSLSGLDTDALLEKASQIPELRDLIMRDKARNHRGEDE